jgi:simple sugar transport system permease protein
MLAAAAFAAAIWIGISVVLKARYRVDEIISTLLLNYIAINFLHYLVFGPWVNPVDGMPHTSQYAEYERLPQLAPGLDASLLIAMLFVVGAAWLVHLSRAGGYMRFVHANRRMAQFVGVPVAGVTLLAVFLSGALSGIAGYSICAATEGRLTEGFYGGYGFSGVLIAFLAGNRPIAVTLVAVFVATLFVLGQSLQIFYQIPFAIVQLVQAIVVIFVAASEFWIRHRVRWSS